MKTNVLRRTLMLTLLAALFGVAAPSFAGANSENTNPLIQSVGMVPINEDIPSPDFALLGPQGEEQSLAKYQGRYLLLNFWATWCEPCRAEMPSLQKLSEELEGSGLSVLAISSLESAELVNAFLDETNLELAVALDLDGLIAYKYAVRGLPLTYLISPQGKIIAASIGAQDWATTAVIEGFKKITES